MLTTLPHWYHAKAQFTRWRELTTGRHHLTLYPIPTVTGFWAWKTTCRTCGATQLGAESTHTAAIHAAHALIGSRDSHTIINPGCTNDKHITAALTEAGHPALLRWHGLAHIQLPADIAGSGNTVATHGNYDSVHNRAAWSFVTDAGWCKSGPIEPFCTVNPCAAELSAIRQALKIYPSGSPVTIVLNNTVVGILLQDFADMVQLGRKLTRRDLPLWAEPRIAGEIKGRIHALGSIRVLWRRPVVDRLHALADTLARVANGTRRKQSDWIPIDVEPIGAAACEPSCTLIHRPTPTDYASRCASSTTTSPPICSY